MHVNSEAIDRLTDEYERCLRPTPEMLSAELYGITDNARYYEIRAEALGFAIDKLGIEYKPPTPR